ncbi:RNA polymerase sigma factor [Actinomadura rubrisoli]|uniref:Sigma-70 family RNA polymerase sigma factor n=1 Tax=Actinomadura rubrisoli TaxID=2530368 RepID=A0A4R5C9V7_9ACTN|nr:sigma-70 family RNA polymerase sigma factor [Actinomadura rubrisoli]TDD95456.1 sigma-70 family RNA polymerase sigma factor [Actinomadura rubrisoli]
MPEPDDGFAGLWDAHYGDVLGYAARRVDHETARDVAAETFLIAWRRRDEIPADHPFPWLLHVARNVLANEARGHRRRGRLWSRLRGDRRTAEPVADVAVGLAEGGRIAAALRRLSPRDREALQLVGWEELDTRDAAVVAGCSAKTFSVRLHRARKRLAAALADLDADLDAGERPMITTSLQRSPLS